MTAFRFTFDINADALKTTDPDTLKALVIERLIEPARRQARDQMHALRKSDASAATKGNEMGECLRTIMLSLMAEANLTVEVAPAGTTVQTELPFETAYTEPADDL